MAHRCPVVITAAALAACAGAANGQSFFEGFNIVPPAGWFMRNNSDSAAGDAWFQGNAGGTFPAQAGDPNSYAGSNYARTSSGASTGATISCWLLTPPVTMANGDALSFYTRSVSGSEGGAYADRMQVRMSTTGASTNVGTAAFDVGDFTTLMLDINPTYGATTYPHGAWQQYNLTVAGLGGPASGRFAFRYFVENGGINGIYSNYIGVDTTAFVRAGSSGACCAADGTCTTGNVVACANSGGTYAGDGVTCAAANCPQPGACCNADGSCQVMPAAQCSGAGQVFAGNGVTCAAANCGATGACCQLDSTCSVVNQASCKGSNGLFRGTGSACGTAANCPTAYPYNGGPVFITDAVGTTCGPQVLAEITVTDSFTIGAADVSLFATHTYQGDLSFWLKHVQTGTTVQIVNMPSAGTGSFGADNFGGSPAAGDLFRLIDTAANFYRSPPAAPGGTDNVRWQWKPENPLAAFAGQNSAGQWQLIAQDCGPGDFGNIEYWILSLQRPGGNTCYANCDASTTPPVANVADFTCFLQKFAANDAYANCDGSTTPPVINVADFTCFLQKFAAGCP